MDGDPYVTPMSFIVEGDRILFRTLPGRKLEGLMTHPTVCIEVSRYDGETGRVTIEGLMQKYRDVMGSGLQAGSPLVFVHYTTSIPKGLGEVSVVSTTSGPT